MENKKKMALEFFKKSYLTILIYALCEVFREYVNIYIVEVIGRATDSVLKRNIDAIKGDLKSFIAAIIAAIVLVPIVDYIWKRFYVGTGVEFDSSMYNKFLKQKKTIIDRYEKGELAFRISEDPLEFRSRALDIVAEFLVFIIVILQSFYLMASIHLWFGAVCIVLSVLPGLIPFLSKEWLKKLFKNEKEILGEIADQEKKLVENFSYTKVNSLKEWVINSFKKVYDKYYAGVFRKKSLYERAALSFNEFFVVICEIIIYIIGSYLISKGSITVGQAVRFFGLSLVIKEVTQNLIYWLKAYYLLSPAADRLLEIVGNEEKSGGKVLSSVDSIEVDELDFSYGEKEILKDISLSINKGEHIIIKGENGSGKTTLIKLLTGLYDNYTGSIKINDFPLDKVDLKSLRDNITLVSQMPFLFNTSVYENVAMANDNVNHEEILDVLKMLELYDIRDKNAGEMGAYLSGGQRQRISIARAFIRNTPVVILDEPDNSLDSEGNKWVKQLFSDSKKTLIVITHKSSWCETADKVYSL